jgi:type II secretion system protein G
LEVETLKKERRTSAFTLIELLIVVAIIAILAAIAVPNFLEAQTRSKVSRVKADMRSLATAIESYAVDNNHYPDAYQATGYAPNIHNFFNDRLIQITTPIAYITSLPVDIFRSKAVGGVNPQNLNTVTFEYTDRRTQVATNSPCFCTFTTNATYTAYMDDNSASAWDMWSPGPIYNASPWDAAGPYGPSTVNSGQRQRRNNTYDPTNGTVSLGAIWRTNVVTDK